MKAFYTNQRKHKVCETGIRLLTTWSRLLLEKLTGSQLVMDWIELAQDRDMWRARVNAVMNLRVP